MGLCLRGILAACGTQLPTVIVSPLASLSETFTGTALVTLGLSLGTRTAVLRGRRVAALCLLTSKVLLCPLLMRLFAALLIRPKDAIYGTNTDGSDRWSAFDSGEGAAQAFAFVYGMLPT